MNIHFLRKNIWRLYPVLILIGIFLFLYLEGQKRRRNFYKNSLHNVIIGRNNWQMRATTFILDNKIKIDSSGLKKETFDLKIGDSIVKKPKSYVFEVYRKADNGTYYFFRKYKLKP